MARYQGIATALRGFTGFFFYGVSMKKYLIFFLTTHVVSSAMMKSLFVCAKSEIMLLLKI
jgi:hypothetical protein